MQKGAAIFLILVFLTSSCARQNKSITDSSQYSTVETELGEAIHRQILQAIPVYKGEELNRYVRSIGEKIAAVADRKNLSYQFVILEDDRIYATHAPGGYVYITTGFFKFLSSEIELAGILAYEIAMLQYKDPRLSKVKKAFDLLLKTGSYVGPAFGSIGVLSVIGLALIGNFALSEKSLMDQTREADKRALDYLLKSGYDPQGLINPLYRMTDPNSFYRAYLYDYLQSHPVPPGRFKRIEKLFSDLPLMNRQFDAGRDVYLEMTQSVRTGALKK